MSEGKTPRNLDQALASWPEPERKDVEWTPEKASSARFADVSDEELLGPPLRAGAAEGTAPSGPASSRGKDRAKQQQQLQELAKLAEMKTQPEPAEEREESSGVVHLAALAADEGQNVDGTPLATPSVQAAPAPTEQEETRAAKPPSRQETGVGRPSWLVVGGLVAAAAAIALVFGMKHPGPEEAPVQVTVVAPAPAAPAPTTTAAPAATESQEALDKAVDPSTLPPAEYVTGGRPSSPAAAPAAVAKPAAVAAASAAPQPAAAQVPPATPGSSASLEALMQQAAGTPSTATTATATGTATEAPAAAPTSVVLKPSQGAIQGALGAALPGARACLGPDDPISRATVTFQSDGTVQSVSVTGGAAGKPAEACIRSALMRAKVPPFAVPTFTAPATIRPE